MNKQLNKIILAPLLLLAFAGDARTADLLDLLKKGAATQTNSISGLSQAQMVSGLKQALSNGVGKAVATLGKPDGFLRDAKVKIPMPESLTKVESTLRSLRQEKLADEFVATMNRAAEGAVPEAAIVLSEAVKEMTVADATSILTGTNNAATQYFRRTSETNLHTRFLPIVKAATEKAGVTSAYKRMTDKLSGGFGGFGGFGSAVGSMPNLDDYVTRKALDGLFFKIAEQEKLIRENPAARTTELLQKVFGAVAK